MGIEFDILVNAVHVPSRKRVGFMSGDLLFFGFIGGTFVLGLVAWALIAFRQLTTGAAPLDPNAGQYDPEESSVGQGSVFH